MAVSDGKNKKQKPLDPHQMHFTVQQFLHSCLNMFEAHHIDNLQLTLPVHGQPASGRKAEKKPFIASF